MDLPLVLSSELNVKEVVDSLLPDEQSLSQAALVQSRLRNQLRETRDEIAYLRAELDKDQSSNRIQIIQELIVELLLQTNRIKEKATESEAIVRDITRDIQTLDKGKKNLMASITILKRLQMLVTALSQLESLVPSKRYREIASSLAAVKELSIAFKPYVTVDRVAAMYKTVQERQNQCRGLVTDEFEAFFVPEANKPATNPTTLSEACAVVDVLGDEVRNSLLDRYATLELREYRRIFRSTDEAGQLDNIARRYAWFRRILKAHDDDRERIFPESWKVGLHLCARFAEVTSQDLSNVLAKVSPLSVGLLMESLQATLAFEQQMSKKYNLPFAEIVRSALPSTSYASPFTPISTTFDPYLSVYVEAQDKAIADLLAPSRGLLKSRTSLDSANAAGSVEGAAPVRVLPSSTEMFYFYGQTLEQCARLSRGVPLKDLVKVFGKWLKVYAEDVLLNSLKRTDPVGRRSTDRRSVEGRANTQELRNTCLVLNTAEYCHTTASQLEDMIKERINPELADQISFEPQKDLFVSVISSCLLSLLRELETTIESTIALILRTPWEHIENVSGPSVYVLELVRGINQVGDVIREGVEGKKYERNFFDKAVGVVMSRMIQAVVRSRPLKKVGAEQLLLDLSLLKRCFLELPNFSKEDARSSASYQRHVQASTSPYETILKVVLAPEDPPEGFVQNYTLLVRDRSFSNFQKILDFKGTPRKEQNHLLDIFIAVTSVQDDLTESSFLSSLDMDITAAPQSVLMNASASDRALLSPIGSAVNLTGLAEGLAGEGGGSSSSKPFGSFFRNLTRRESGM
ncbi:Vps53-like protein [Mrakia frigida]|uniref:Vps53p n=1 Tax=Mrakia frigida TaxID=29902 RepID=UPI003FCC0898